MTRLTPYRRFLLDIANVSFPIVGQHVATPVVLDIESESNGDVRRRILETAMPFRVPGDLARSANELLKTLDMPKLVEAKRTVSYGASRGKFWNPKSDETHSKLKAKRKAERRARRRNRRR